MNDSYIQVQICQSLLLAGADLRLPHVPESKTCIDYCYTTKTVYENGSQDWKIVKTILKGGTNARFLMRAGASFFVKARRSISDTTILGNEIYDKEGTLLELLDTYNIDLICLTHLY